MGKTRAAEGKTAPKKARDRLNIDIEKERKRWERAAAKLHKKLTPFVKHAVEELIRREGLE